MTLEALIIAAIRLLGSLPVLRWPFYGGLFALLVDQSDLLFMNILHLGGIGDYQTFDKLLDQAYLVTFLLVALGWQSWQRAISVGLFAYRFLGFVLFEAFEERWLLLVFPNLFEFWFLALAGIKQFGLQGRLSSRQWILFGVAMLSLKMFQEYALHYGRWLDDFTTIEAIEAAWRFITPW